MIYTQEKNIDYQLSKMAAPLNYKKNIHFFRAIFRRYFRRMQKISLKNATTERLVELVWGIVVPDQLTPIPIKSQKINGFLAEKW